MKTYNVTYKLLNKTGAPTPIQSVNVFANDQKQAVINAVNQVNPYGLGGGIAGNFQLIKVREFNACVSSPSPINSNIK